MELRNVFKQAPHLSPSAAIEHSLILVFTFILLLSEGQAGGLSCYIICFVLSKIIYPTVRSTVLLSDSRAIASTLGNPEVHHWSQS
jgi:hypothetical protein